MTEIENSTAAPKVSDGFDLAKLDTKPQAEVGAPMALRHPGSNAIILLPSGKPFEIMLLGMDSKIAKQQIAKNTNARLAMGNRLKLKSEDLEAEAIELLVALTTGWPEDVVFDGEPFPYSPVNARMLYKTYPWAKEQADQFIADRANYLGNS